MTMYEKQVSNISSIETMTTITVARYPNGGRGVFHGDYEYVCESEEEAVDRIKAILVTERIEK